MALNWIWSRIGSALPLIGIALALANWNAMPAAAWAWAAAIVMFVVMAVVHRRPQLVAPVRDVASVASAVARSASMMIIALALTLAHAYGVVDNPARGMLRTIMIIAGAYLAMTGNAMPRMLPPTSSMPCGGSRVQAFQRFAGWTWVLCGLGFATAWLVLSIDAAAPMAMALVATAILVTMVQFLRLRKPSVLCDPPISRLR